MVCKLFCKEKSCPIKKAIVFKSQTEAWTDLSSSGMIYIVTIFSSSFWQAYVRIYICSVMQRYINGVPLCSFRELLIWIADLLGIGSWDLAVAPYLKPPT